VGLLNRHLDDDDFADVWCARTTIGAEESDRPAESHLRTCAECRARYTSFTGWLAGLRADACGEVDDVFGQERLALQQQQIFRRLEALEHPGRIIAFPKFARPVAASQASGRRRWTAAAAAVGLITGIGLGQLIDFRTGRPAHEVLNPRPLARSVTPSVDTSRSIQADSEDTDETFIEPEITSSQVRVPESLQYLNAITPGARDFDPR
jgi:hypothetical protein